MRHDRGHRPRTGPAVATATDSCQEGEVEDGHPHGNIPGDAERGVAQVLAGGLLQTVVQRPRATAAAGSGLRRHTDTQGKHRTLVGRMPHCGLQHGEGQRKKNFLPLTETSPRTILPTVSRVNISYRGRKKEKSPTCTKDLSPSFRTLIHHWRKGQGLYVLFLRQW